MKGVVFTEFLELVEDKFGLTTVDNVVTKGCPFQRGPANPNEFVIEYQSSRPFADLAEGLIEASIDHFGESFVVRRTVMDGELGTHCLFHLQHAK